MLVEHMKRLTCCQNLVKNFAEDGFSLDVKPLSHFEDDYDLEPINGEEDVEDEDEDDDGSEGTGSESGEEDDSDGA